MFKLVLFTSLVVSATCTNLRAAAPGAAITFFETFPKAGSGTCTNGQANGCPNIFDSFYVSAMANTQGPFMKKLAPKVLSSVLSPNWQTLHDGDKNSKKYKLASAALWCGFAVSVGQNCQFAQYCCDEKMKDVVVKLYASVKTAAKGEHNPVPADFNAFCTRSLTLTEQQKKDCTSKTEDAEVARLKKGFTKNKKGGGKPVGKRVSDVCLNGAVHEFKRIMGKPAVCVKGQWVEQS